MSEENEIQSGLIDIIGYDDLDLVIELIARRKELVQARKISETQRIDNHMLAKLQTRQERELALRQKDYEHKHAPLAPSINRSEPQYPHVYKAHTAGNTLSVGGRKYVLPLGSERKEHEVCFDVRTVF